MKRVSIFRGAWFVLIVCYVFPGGAQPLDDAESVSVPAEFLLWCEENRPRRGSIIVQYVPSEAARVDGVLYVTKYGFDAQSGAWFIVGPETSGGRTPSGVEYRGSRESGSTILDGSLKGSMPLSIVAEAFPRAYLVYFVEQPRAIVKAVSLANGGWQVEYRQWIHRNGPHIVVEFDDSGLVVRRWRIDPEDRREEYFSYSEELLSSGFEVATGLRGSLNLVPVEFDYDAEGNPAMFETSRVEGFLRELSVAVEIGRRAAQHGYVRGADGQLMIDPDAPLLVSPYGGSQVRAWRWPLFGVGLVFVALAGVEVWRRRR